MKIYLTPIYAEDLCKRAEYLTVLGAIFYHDRDYHIVIVHNRVGGWGVGIEELRKLKDREDEFIIEAIEYHYGKNVDPTWIFGLAQPRDVIFPNPLERLIKDLQNELKD